MTDQVDLWLGQQARDDGMEAVKTETFTDLVNRTLKRFPSDSLVTGEDVRLLCESHGIYAHHVNAWGATINALVRRGVLEATGAWRQSHRVKAHARENKVYRITTGLVLGRDLNQ